MQLFTGKSSAWKKLRKGMENKLFYGKIQDVIGCKKEKYDLKIFCNVSKVYLKKENKTDDEKRFFCCS